MPARFPRSVASAASEPPFPEKFPSAFSVRDPSEGRREAGPGRACPAHHGAQGAPGPEDTSVRSPALPGGWDKYPEARDPRLPDFCLSAPALSLNVVLLASKVVHVMAKGSVVIGQVWGFF